MYSDILKLRLKELRTLKGLKQQEVAYYCGVSQGTYNNWETGRRTPEIETIIKLADFYTVDLDYLFGRDTQTLRRLKEN